ncbi:MAG: RNA-binding domain-containing protein [Pseudomonadales bacterium]|nr:RNA-binding domain-containing protein [Pseudomonadales bacterium]
MSQEGQLLERKSLRAVLGNSANWAELAKECIAFANAVGGVLEIGIEDDAESPPADQRIPSELPEQVCRKLADRTVNVQILPRIVAATDGGQYLELRVPRASAVASTTDGRYFLRVADQSRPITGDDVMRLANERTSLAWETQTTLGMSRKDADPVQRDRLLTALRRSDRVKSSVKERTDDELLDHYLLAEGPVLTNLGVLCIGSRSQRARLTTAPVIQAVKYDQHGQKVNKLVWDDYTRSPIELIESVWSEIPDFREHYELPDGLYRQEVPAYDEEVVRELLVNALVHRPYTHRGDIFVNLHPDRLELVNPAPSRSA